jgi:hypothetical protein
MGATRRLTDGTLAFCVREHAVPAVEVRVNFGVFAGRNATQAEIDELARELADELDSFAILAEERHEFGDSREAALRQVVIEVASAFAGVEPDELCERILEVAEAWAERCIHARSDLGELGSPLGDLP